MEEIATLPSLPSRNTPNAQKINFNVRTQKRNILIFADRMHIRISHYNEYFGYDAQDVPL